MKNRDFIVTAHAYQLEVILLGVAIGAKGDRAKVLDGLADEDMVNDDVAACLRAVRDKDVESVRDFFAKRRRVLVGDGQTLVEAIIKRHHDMQAGVARRQELRKEIEESYG